MTAIIGYTGKAERRGALSSHISINVNVMVEVQIRMNSPEYFVMTSRIQKQTETWLNHDMSTAIAATIYYRYAALS